MSTKFDLKEIIAGIRKEQAIKATNEGADKGWIINVKDADTLQRTQMFLYVYDTLTQFTWSCSVDAEQFWRISATHEILVDDGQQHIKDHLADVIHCAAKTKLNAELESNLASALSLYAGVTEALKRLAYLNGGRHGGGHFFVLNYRNNNKGSMLRPFARTDDTNSLVSYSEFYQNILKVISVDKAHHPDWFR